MLPLSQNTAPWLLQGNKFKPKKKTSNKVGVLMDFNKVADHNPVMKPLENICFKFKSSHRQHKQNTKALTTAEIAIQTTIVPINQRNQTLLTDESRTKPASPARSQGQVLDTDHTSDLNSLAGDSNTSRRVTSKYSRANLKPRPSSAMQQRKQNHIQKPPPDFKLKQLFLDEVGELNIVSNTVLAQRNNNSEPKKEVTAISKKNSIFDGKDADSSRGASRCKQNITGGGYSKYSPNVAAIQIKRPGKSEISTLDLPLHIVRSIHSQQIRDNINFWEQNSNDSRPSNMELFKTERQVIPAKDCFSQMFNDFCK